MAEPVKNIVIVGGGTAGWMTAASLSRYFEGQLNGQTESERVSITLVESDSIGTIGVGEATIPNIVDFNSRLGIDEIEFIKATQATFKLGIEFVDWHQQGDKFFHPFADYGMPVNNVDFHHYLNKLRTAGREIDLADFSFPCVLAKHGNFAQPHAKPTSPLADYSYAYHFDAGLYASYLMKYATQKGVKRIEGMIEQVNTNDVSGFITSVMLKNGQQIEGELFIDCSGFNGLLINKTLKVEYEDWSHWLLCDRAIAVQTESVKAPTPYTSSIARENGWQWHIPLQHRVGNGYIFSSQFESSDSAKQRLLDNIEGKLVTEPREIKFLPGRRKQMWNKNCVAIGLSSGFLEPLESTSISLIQSGIAKLLSFFPDQSFNEHDIAEVNRLHNSELEHVRDFLILHYKLTKRDDSPFWQYCKDMTVPDTLAHKMALFKSRGHIIVRENESFEPASWLTMYNGFSYQAERFDERANAISNDVIESNLQQMKHSMLSAAAQAPSHQDFIEMHCKAEKK